MAAIDVSDPGANTVALSDYMGMGVFNVKQFGALGTATSGDSGPDDTSAIQDAINARQSASNLNRGIIYFPPGMYRITESLTMATSDDNVNFVFAGCGNASTIIGNFNEWLFKNGPDASVGGSQQIQVIENLFFTNSSQGTSSGCIRYYGGKLRVLNCFFKGYAGLDVSGGTGSGACTEAEIFGCTFVGHGNLGYGLALGGQSSCYGCDFKGFSDGIRASGIGNGIYSPHVETCNGSAVAAGFDCEQTPDSLTASVVHGLTAEGVGLALYCHQANRCHFSAIEIQGEHLYGSVGGIRMRNHCSDTTISNVLAGGEFGFIAFLTASVSGTTLSVTATNNTLAAGYGIIDRSNTNPGAPGGFGWNYGDIVTQLNGTPGGIGDYQLSANGGTQASRSMTAYNSASTNPAIEVGGAGITLSGVVFEGIDASASEGAIWQVHSTAGAQFRGCKNYTPTSQAIGSPPAGPRDGDLWTFTNANTSTLNADIIAAGTGTTRAVGRYSKNDSKWYYVAKG